MRKRTLKTQAQKDQFLKDLQKMVDQMAKEFEEQAIEEGKKKKQQEKNRKMN